MPKPQTGQYVMQQAGVGMRMGEIDKVTPDTVFVRWGRTAKRALPYSISRFIWRDAVWELTNAQA